jgi:hypothetical protein
VESKNKKNMEKKLGKIELVQFGLGGYQDSQLGLSITLGDGGWAVGDFKGNWDAQSIKWNENCQWTEEDRDKGYSETMRFLSKLLKDAKVRSVDKLKGIPVEVIFDGNVLKEWRVLTEVL